MYNLSPSEGELAIFEGKVSVWDGSKWVITIAGDELTIESRIQELEKTVDRLVSQLMPEYQV